MTFDLCKIDWTAVAAIISFIMVVVTSVALILNNLQLKELKRQWEEQNRPRLFVSLCKNEDLSEDQFNYVIKIRNNSNVNCYDLNIKLDELDADKFPDKFDFDLRYELVDEINGYINTINNCTCNLGANQTTEYLLMSTFISEGSYKKEYVQFWQDARRLHRCCIKEFRTLTANIEYNNKYKETVSIRWDNEEDIVTTAVNNLTKEVVKFNEYYAKINRIR